MRASPQQLLSIGDHSGTLHLQIYHRVRALILSGAWPAGTQLPSSRSLARDLGISRNTALLAIEKLTADGWIISRPGSGIFVSSEAPSTRPETALNRAGEARPAGTPVPFEIGQAGTDIFPIHAWKKIQSNVWSKSAQVALHEGDEAGWLPLRRAVAGYLGAVRGVACSPEQILIHSSTQAAMDLAVRLLARPGDSIWVEDPGYPYAREAFQAHGLRLVPLEVDREGVVVAQGIAAAPDARLAYLTPACQFPLGAILSPQRREELREWLASSNLFVIEDDWDFNAVFGEQKPLEPLAAVSTERVIYIHSFNRVMFPALRIAAMVVPVGLVDAFTDARRAVDGFTNMANQVGLTEFIEQGLLSSHLRRVREVYEGRRHTMHQSARQHLSRWAALEEDQSGLQTLAWTRGIRDSSLALAARRSGVACLALSDLSAGVSRAPEALILGFAAYPSAVIKETMLKLEKALTDSATFSN